MYINKKNRLIYRFTMTNNDIFIGDFNTYDHKLIYKAKIIDNEIIKLSTKQDEYSYDYNKRRGDKR